MSVLKYTLLSFITVFTLASCEKEDSNCMVGTWRNNKDIGDTIFYHDEMVFNEDKSGELSEDSRSCSPDDDGYKKKVYFDWSESEGIVTLTYRDSVINYCNGVNVHTDSVYTIAYSCVDDGLWMIGVTWEKQ